ncbi:hypothetical protein K439DRAFT_548748 [Ramaria rubella]|nr:hypothetical protein K439DRAFT_548748 [Ramaria rubella]
MDTELFALDFTVVSLWPGRDKESFSIFMAAYRGGHSCPARARSTPRDHRLQFYSMRSNNTRKKLNLIDQGVKAGRSETRQRKYMFKKRKHNHTWCAWSTVGSTQRLNIHLEHWLHKMDNRRIANGFVHMYGGYIYMNVCHLGTSTKTLRCERTDFLDSLSRQ